MIVAPPILELLEFQKALSPFRDRLRGELGARALETAKPCKTFEQLEKRTALFRGWIDFVDRCGEISWNADLVPVSPLFEGARSSGILSGEELLLVRSLMTAARRVREELSVAVGDFPVLEPLRSRLRDFNPELEALAVIEDSGRLADNASPKLQAIREELEALKRSGRRTAVRLLEDPNILNMLQERSLAWRDGRFLLLVRQEYINRFPGLAVDRSGSGSSVYMEPRMLSAVNNGLMLRTRDERDEERLILLELTRRVLSRERAIVEAEAVLGELDLFGAADALMHSQGWVIPELTRKRAFRLVGARHPLLREAAVPVDVSCGEGFGTLVVTGPNTGGKTVVLKTAGVCLAMAWSGLPLPVRDGSAVGNFDALYADIGDEQSIEQNLSTFSAHLKNIIGILGAATESSVVLLDELGAGTDPQEGAALGVAILETLRRKRSLVLATTHHNPIKQYALTTSGVETASMEFDAERLAPTYRLLMGVPGKSNALMIARRYGMPESVLELAQGALDARVASAEDLMGELNERRAALDRAEREFQERERETERLKQVYRDRVTEIDLQRDRILEAADRRASALLSRAEETSRGMIRDLEETVKTAAHQGLNDRRQQLHALRKGMDRRQAKREKREIEARPKSFSVEPGATVQVAGSGVVGLVESVVNGKAHLMAGPMRLEVSVDRLVATDRKAKVALPPAETGVSSVRETVPSSLMLRGMNVDEALPLLANYLDRAYRAHHASVVVIHGRGEGILRREVHALCSRLKYVKDYRLGNVGEGGYGVTIVSFA